LFSFAQQPDKLASIIRVSGRRLACETCRRKIPDLVGFLLDDDIGIGIQAGAGHGSLAMLVLETGAAGLQVVLLVSALVMPMTHFATVISR
jgi:hypothetical protein